MENHVDRTPRMGASVMISGTWYKITARGAAIVNQVVAKPIERFFERGGLKHELAEFSHIGDRRGVGHIVRRRWYPAFATHQRFEIHHTFRGNPISRIATIEAWNPRLVQQLGRGNVDLFHRHDHGMERGRPNQRDSHISTPPLEGFPRQPFLWHVRLRLHSVFTFADRVAPVYAC